MPSVISLFLVPCTSLLVVTNHWIFVKSMIYPTNRISDKSFVTINWGWQQENCT